MIDTVIFDIGKVLMGYGWEKYLRRVVPEEEAYRAVERAVFLNPAWAEHDKGLLTEEEEILDFAAAAPAYEREIRAVYENLGECTWLLPYTEAWIQELKEKGRKVYALSNWPKHIYEQKKEEMAFLHQMDGYVLSYRSHRNKPDPEAFQILLSRYGIEPSRAVFIDDTMVNVEAARKLGLSVVHFQSYEQAVSELRRLGV